MDATAIKFRTALPTVSTSDQALTPRNPPIIQTRRAPKQRAHRCISCHALLNDHRRTRKNIATAHPAARPSGSQRGGATVGTNTTTINKYHGNPSASVVAVMIHGRGGVLVEGVRHAWRHK